MGPFRPAGTPRAPLAPAPGAEEAEDAGEGGGGLGLESSDEEEAEPTERPGSKRAQRPGAGVEGGAAAPPLPTADRSVLGGPGGWAPRSNFNYFLRVSIS